MASGRERYDSAFVAVELPDGLNRAGQITVAGNDQGHVKGMEMAVSHHFDSNVHVRHLFFIG